MMNDIIGDPTFLCGIAIFCLVMGVLFLALIKSRRTEAEYHRIDREVAMYYPNDEAKEP